MNCPILFWPSQQLETYYLPVPRALSLQTICVAAVLYYYVNEVNKSCVWILLWKSREASLNNKILKVQVTLTSNLAWICNQYFNKSFWIYLRYYDFSHWDGYDIVSFNKCIKCIPAQDNRDHTAQIHSVQGKTKGPRDFLPFSSQEKEIE